MEEAESPVGINAEAINRTAVVRDPYARWCGRRGAARPLPIPIVPSLFSIFLLQDVMRADPAKEHLSRLKLKSWWSPNLSYL